MGLHLVQFDPNDYKLGEILAHKDGDELTTLEKIGSVLSLYFQWKEDANATCYLDTFDRSRHTISIDYDKEERSLSQLYIKLPQTAPTVGATKIFIRLEVFNGCYEFESAILDKFQDEGEWIICSAPDKIKSVKMRKSTRLEARENIPAKIVIKAKTHDVKITTLTLQGFTTNVAFPALTNGTIEIIGSTFDCYHVRDTEGGSAFKLQLTSDRAASDFFQIYATFAYPNLSPRKNVDYNKLYELFVEAGFFGNFSGKFDEADRASKAIQCWKSLEPAEHITTADYVAVKNDSLVGSSSCALAFKTESHEYWVFHQLCAIKDSDSFDLTSSLYSWRSEYLWNRTPELTSVFWFRSESRWLERIYVKYLMQNPEKGAIAPAQLYSYIHKRLGSATKGSVREPYGEQDRAYYQEGKVLGGLGPDYVHINRNMNLIMGAESWNCVYKAAESLTSTLGRDEGYFRVVMPYKHSPPDLSNDFWDYQKGVDRHAEIKKDGMLDFIACLHHSIAVTKRKHAKAI